MREFDDFTYTWTFTKGGTTEIWGGEQQPTPAIVGPLLTKAAHDGGQLRLSLYNHGEPAQQSPALAINVTDDLTTQIIEFGTLADHYHQGDTLRLQLTVDPPPVEGDTLAWEWKWPGMEAWLALPGVVNNAWETTAEQALDGVQVRAVLTYAAPGLAPAISTLRTIHVDDHGAAARQKPTIAGVTSVTPGDTVTLTRALPENGPTILTAHRWEHKAAGSEEWTIIAGATGEALTFTAALADDGAQYHVLLIKPNGEIAYGPSPTVTLNVTGLEPMPLRPVVLDSGHMDLFELTWNAGTGQLDLKVKDDTTLYAPKVAYRDPEDVTVAVDTALSELMFGPDDLPPGYEFVPRNKPFYLLDEVQKNGLPWPGWSTERLLGSLPEGVTIPYDLGSVEFAVEVNGPGDVVTFVSGPDGTPMNRFIDTTDAAPDVILTGSSIHYHTAWLFTEPGDYVLTVTPRAYPSFPSKDNPLTGPAHSYHIHVGPRPEFETVPEGFTASILGAPDSVTPGTTVNLRLVLDGPQPAIGGYQWYHYIDGEGLKAIPGATGQTVSLAVDPWDSAQVVIFDPSGRGLTSIYAPQFVPPPGPPHAPVYVGAGSDAPGTAYVSWSTPYNGGHPLTGYVVTLIPESGEPIVQELPGDAYKANFAGVPVGTYTATVQAFNELGAGAVSEPSAPFTVESSP
ncbi:MAG: choice-of-anchor M domain-containing protein, partial [Verrucomicrobiae bacterium]|nr:choice-of-anchor M domain-containing protein [Verrucomicrobiae bacterium]